MNVQYSLCYWSIWRIYIYIYIYNSFNTLSGGKSCFVAPGAAVVLWATETVLLPWLAVDESRVSHVLSHVLWWKKYIYIHIYIIIIIIIIMWYLHRYPWPSLATSPYHSSPLVGLQDYISYPHIAAVCSSWSSCLCLAICGGPLEYITYELVLASPAVSCMSGSSNLDSFRDGS